MWEPIVKDNKLCGLSLNPLGKQPVHYFSDHPDWRKSNQYLKSDGYIAWQRAESQRRLVEVDEAEYWIDSDTVFQTSKTRSAICIIKSTDTFTADESNGKLINLKVI